MEFMGLTQGLVTLTNADQSEGGRMTEGKKVFSRSSSGKQQGEEPPTRDREIAIVRLVAQGYRDNEIGERLFIKEQTVNDYLHGIFDKLGVSDRLELTLYAIHHHLMEQR